MQRVLANKCTIFNCILFTIGCWLFLWVAYEHRSEFADAKWPHKTSKKAYRVRKSFEGQDHLMIYQLFTIP